MIEGGWNFVWPAYAVTLGALGVLALFIVMQLRVWSKRAKDLDKP